MHWQWIQKTFQLTMIILSEVDDVNMAIYSNSEYTVMSYDSIFENLWTKAEMKNAENLNP